MIQFTEQGLVDLLASVSRLPSHDPKCVKATDHSFIVGEKYLIRTVTMYYTGRVVRVTDYDVVLADAAWIADVGRYSEALETGKLNEVEPYPNEVVVARGAVVDFTVWSHDLPRTVK